MNKRRRRRQKWKATVRYWRHVWRTFQAEGGGRVGEVPGWIDRITEDVSRRAGWEPYTRIEIVLGNGSPVLNWRAKP